MGPAVDHTADHAGLFEHLQVPRDRRLGDAECPGDLADSRVTAAQSLDDLAPERMREGSENVASHLLTATERYRGVRTISGMRRSAFGSSSAICG